jgi:hypothetical protein
MRPYDLAIVGAGPIGLEAAAAAAAGGLKVVVLERREPAQYMADWGHVRLFTPFAMNAGPAGLALLKSEGPDLPDPQQLLTGRELRERYLLPLAHSVSRRAEFLERHRVLSISRGNFLKGEFLGQSTRQEAPFRLLCQAPGDEVEIMAQRVFDCSGTYGRPNWAGPGGTPARGERSLRGSIEYGLPDVLGRDRSRYEGVRTLVLGGGHSAATTVLSLAALARDRGKTRFTWATRRSESPPIAVIAEDSLPERRSLVEAANSLAEVPPEGCKWLGGAQLAHVSEQDDGYAVGLSARSGETVERYERIVANVGSEPDDEIYRQLQIHECYASRGPMKLSAALLASASDGPVDCLELGDFSADALENPEPGFFILGAKSYGKNPAFLMQTGYEQVRDALRLSLATA